jgi:hypothetical protein
MNIEVVDEFHVVIHDDIHYSVYLLDAFLLKLPFFQHRIKIDIRRV